ncbi:serine/threonine-protein kinase ATG1a isoform X1 [Hevea brasiliensis]|uniref:serine/threonine-protein kinase ATG1a isoform X1 n=1 Tax=Hevea brasiliensis TaxID=3981 RepID=UPI0025F25B82|nr:serine/threonine-protein kinase ATG1a isoform X1 [Hevea brasiliensis]
MDFDQTRLVGDYILGPRIGSGSFAVVWRSRHRQSGREVAVKEIDRKLLSPKVSENLLKEISILSTIDHPNIIRLFESIETDDRIFLVLEYCDGGDLAAYIHRHGKVSEAVARHFMRQLAAGLQVLQEKHLIHRDLKPQNLLLSSNEATPQLKIADFGFARSLTPQDLADTLCGSPLYMAPEIIQNQKYDAKADLWSVGAILFQLVTGKPPFDGNSQYQLFQNILTSTELQFPHGALEELHPDCVDLCKRLLRQNPVMRLTFKEFFNHKFLGEPSVVHGKVPGNMSCTKSVHGSIPNIAHDRTRKSVDGSQCSSYQPGVVDSLESIEKDYVLVNCHFASMENLSCYSETSLQDNSATRVSVCPPKKNDQDIAVTMQTKQHVASSFGGAEHSLVHRSDPLDTSCSPTILSEVKEQSMLHPSRRLHLLHQYVQAVAEVAQEKYNAGLFLESFSVELVVLAIWKKALQIFSSWVASTAGSKSPESSSANESTSVHGGIRDKIDFGRPSSACKWAEQEFVAAYDRAEKSSHHIQDMDGWAVYQCFLVMFVLLICNLVKIFVKFVAAAAEMPDAMEIIFQKALAVGTSGAVDEYMENKGSAKISYSKAMVLLSFIVEEAASLPLKPPFILTPTNEKRIQSYIINLQSHQSHF